MDLAEILRITIRFYLSNPVCYHSPDMNEPAPAESCGGA
jgi:hypothetical protein